MDATERDRSGRPWLFATDVDASTDRIVEALGFSGPTSELDASTWDVRESMFSELAVDFPMPDYFGHNWDALNECLYTESFEGRLIVIRNVSQPVEPNLARFIDLFGFVRIPEREAQAAYPSLFDRTPGRVAVVVVGVVDALLEASWPDGRARRYRFQRLQLTDQSGDIRIR
jgi:RNAse (barnase) inhibitor barstar